MTPLGVVKRTASFSPWRIKTTLVRLSSLMMQVGYRFASVLPRECHASNYQSRRKKTHRVET